MHIGSSLISGGAASIGGDHHAAGGDSRREPAQPSGAVSRSATRRISGVVRSRSRANSSCVDGCETHSGGCHARGMLIVGARGPIVAASSSRGMKSQAVTVGCRRHSGSIRRGENVSAPLHGRPAIFEEHGRSCPASYPRDCCWDRMLQFSADIRLRVQYD
jgi:hypothetical protein